MPLLYYRNNLVSLLNLLDLMPEFGVKGIVFSSSCTVYGQPDVLPVDETAPIKPAVSPYGNTKQICEEIITDTIHAGAPFRAILLRYFNPIGAHPSAEIGELPQGVPQNLVPYLTQAAMGIRKELSVFGDDYNTPDGSCIRDYINVVDLANAIQRRYREGFLGLKNGGVSGVCGDCNPSDFDKIFIGLGAGEHISISAGILIVHCKASLSEAIAASHSLLSSVAKEKGGRNAFAIRLAKRSGGEREICYKWDARNTFNPDKTCLESLARVMRAASSGLLSSKLLYSLEALGPVVGPIIDNKELLLNTIRYEVTHRTPKGKVKECESCIEDLAGILFTEDKAGKLEFQPAAAIIAGFLGKGVDE